MATEGERVEGKWKCVAGEKKRKQTERRMQVRNRGSEEEIAGERKSGGGQMEGW